MNREKWREMVRDIRAGGTTWWWWWWKSVANQVKIRFSAFNLLNKEFATFIPFRSFLLTSVLRKLNEKQKKRKLYESRENELCIYVPICTYVYYVYIMYILYYVYIMYILCTYVYYVYMYPYVHMYIMYICTHMYIIMYVCTHMYIYTQTHIYINAKYISSKKKKASPPKRNRSLRDKKLYTYMLTNK